MGESIKLKTSDGHEAGAYRAQPNGTPRGAVIVIQEIFGVNAHIRAVADMYAAEGYLAIAPAIFDRAEKDVDIGYTQPDMQKGMALRGKLTWDGVMADCAAAVDAVKSAGRIGIVGYCYGGGVTWLASAKLPIHAAVGYYGGPWGELSKTYAPKTPMLMHFGEKDTGVPIALATEIKEKYPMCAVHTYNAGHGFNCDQRGSYDAYSAALARKRTLGFFEATIG